MTPVANGRRGAGSSPRPARRFYRLDEQRSLALGFAFVDRIVEARGGRLLIASIINEGTSVRFSVPSWTPMEEPA